MTHTLTSLAQLDELVALHVAGWKRGIGGWYPPGFDERLDPLSAPWPFSTSADAILAELEKMGEFSQYYHRAASPDSERWSVGVDRKG